MTTIFITGASGFVGSFLAEKLLTQGYRVCGSGTSDRHSLSEIHDRFVWLQADTTKPGLWQEEVGNADAVINLAGRSIFAYWTGARKKQIYDSRILTTRHLVEAMKPGTVLLSTSAAGIYGNAGETELVEQADPGNDFLARVCIDWEQEAFEALEKNVRVAVMRFGVVLGRGGALSKMLPAFKWMMGGPLGSGMQWFPWIHVQDLYRAAVYLMEHDSLSGAFNFVSPGNVRYKTFARALGKTVHRPAFMKVPALAVKVFMGEMGASFLNSQKAVPEKLLAEGFTFDFPDLSAALENILNRQDTMK